MSLSVFFPYPGCKAKLARKLERPRRDLVVEPFGGSGGYSCFWEPARVILIERDPVVIGVWKYLQRVSPAELLLLPTNISRIEQLPPYTCREAKDLVGFWLNHSRATPAKQRSNWARRADFHSRFWSKTVKTRLAAQVEHIRHWQIIEGSYESAPDVEGHWHIDAPYQATNRYRFNTVDYDELAAWCLSRRGYIQVCEAGGATWLPFEVYAEVAVHVDRQRRSVEAVFEVENS
jgi:hypothetical protein